MSTNILLNGIKRVVDYSCNFIDRRVERRGNRAQELEKRMEEEEGARRPDLFMNAEIPRGSLGVPKHQRDCVPSRRYSITGLSEYPHPCSTLLNCRTLSYAVLGPRLAHTRNRTSTCKLVSTIFGPAKMNIRFISDIYYRKIIYYTRDDLNILPN